MIHFFKLRELGHYLNKNLAKSRSSKVRILNMDKTYAFEYNKECINISLMNDNSTTLFLQLINSITFFIYANILDEKNAQSQNLFIQLFVNAQIKIIRFHTFHKSILINLRNGKEIKACQFSVEHINPFSSQIENTAFNLF